MDISELRIGNYVKFEDKICKVRSLDEISGKVTVIDLYYTGRVVMGVVVNIDKLYPVKLTSELMIDLGFEYAEDDKDFFEKGGIKINIDCGTMELTDLWHTIPVNIMSAHLLQNFYFAWTNEELDI